MAPIDIVKRELAPLLEGLDLLLYDLEHAHGTLRVTLDVEGDAAIDAGQLAAATRAISVMLDEVDPISGRYTLEVSSPGLERNLRIPEHFTGAVGAQVSIRTRPGTEGERRTKGELLVASDDIIEIADELGARRCLAYADIERARTVVDWSRPPKPGRSGAGRSDSAPDIRKAPTS